MNAITRTNFEWFFSIKNKYFQIVVARRKVIDAIDSKIPIRKDAD